MKNKNILPEHWILIAVFGLSIIGVAILSSASAILSYKKFAYNDHYLWNQIFNIVLGLIGFIICRYIPYKKWISYTPFIFIITLLLLVAVFIPGIGAEYGTAHSWISLPGALPNIQPSEFAKITLIFYLAYFFSRKKEKIKDFKEGYLPFVMVTGLICGLVALEPDFGTTLILVVIAGSMFFVAGGSFFHITLSFLAIFVGAFFVAINMGYIYDRFTAFINPFADELGSGYHIIQSLIAVGSGGMWGQGFGASRFKYEGYLPEAQGDSIFAIAAEELGLIRIIFIVIGYFIIAWQGLKIAQKTHDPYAKYLVIGIISWISSQAFINIMVVLSLFPTTGVPLPFISYGGSSMMASLASIGILLNIASHEKEDSYHSYRRRKRWSHNSSSLYKRNYRK